MARSTMSLAAMAAGVTRQAVSKARGGLLPAADVRKGLEVVYLTVRDRLRFIPMSIAAHLVEAAHRPDAEQSVHKLMLEAIDEALTELGNAKMVAVDDDGNELE